MKLNTKQFKDACTTIKSAIDSKTSSLYTEVLELTASNHTLSMSVTNREYFATVRFDIESDEDFRATINAKVFVELVSKITTDEIKLELEERSLKVVGNGSYRLPLIFEDSSLIELPKIELYSPKNALKVKSSILQTILNHNSKELLRGIPTKPVQKYYYVDNKGCITFTSGACVTEFELEDDIKLLLSDKVVKLFKLFKESDDVELFISEDKLSDSLTQTKIKFSTPSVEITAIMTDSNLISSVPVVAIRGMATKDYKYSTVLERKEFLEALNRLILFNTDKTFGYITFTKSKVVITDGSKDNIEELTPANECQSLESYSAIINLNKLNTILTGCEDDYITICYGDSKAFVIKKRGISDIIPELIITE